MTTSTLSKAIIVSTALVFAGCSTESVDRFNGSTKQQGTLGIASYDAQEIKSAGCPNPEREIEELLSYEDLENLPPEDVFGKQEPMNVGYGELSPIKRDLTKEEHGELSPIKEDLTKKEHGELSPIKEDLTKKELGEVSPIKEDLTKEDLDSDVCLAHFKEMVVKLRAKKERAKKERGEARVESAETRVERAETAE